MNDFKSLSRRNFLASSAALAGLSTASGLLGSRAALAQTPLTVGFIYVGPKDDFGYNQAHAEGAAAVKAMPGITVLEEENVPESVDVQNTMESMTNFDLSLIHI
jgi:basic membrane protein A